MAVVDYMKLWMKEFYGPDSLLDVGMEYSGKPIRGSTVYTHKAVPFYLKFSMVTELLG
jgi:hypothetical protein